MFKILRNALMFASAGALLIMSSCNNANSEKAESSKDAKIVASTDSTITAEVDTVVSVAQDIVAKVENDIYDWEEYEKGVMLQLSKTFDNFKDRLRKRDIDYLKSLSSTSVSLLSTAMSVYEWFLHQFFFGLINLQLYFVDEKVSFFNNVIVFFHLP